MSNPIPIRVTRYQCPPCGRTHSSRRGAVEHMARCWQNPDAHGCKTCRNYRPGHDACGCEPGCNWGGQPTVESCAVGVSLAGQPALDICEAHTDPDNPFGKNGADDCPDCRTDGKAVPPGPIVHCEMWEVADADR